ncbi:chitin biosynthesis protein [Niveomyces insectorum RCEF 264]|uniref:Chitin biosynthesis protein n=1 Tax=Niveomyces insectorum RCEF 264 TaxID=1081102 RepID=A0A167VDF7_9HYPO|nr:chitin biosynthesis protein [Niveomyces insectorum RCEF 264]
MLVSLTVGKVDAGVTVLLTQDKRLIEFPSILLPPNIASGSIVDIAVSRNRAAEQAAQDAFAALQSRIHATFGVTPPTAPVLRCRNATQTSVVLEWDPVQLATADLLSLALYRNGQKAGSIPRPLQMHSTKISGLAVDTEYAFHLVLRTTAGTLASERVVRLAAAVERIGAKLVPEPGVVRIDTTHFVTTEGRGLAWEKAVDLNIPVVRPEWVEACEKSGRILGVTKFYLDAVRPTGPADQQVAPQQRQPPPQQQHQQQQQQQQQQRAAADKPSPPLPASTASPSSSPGEAPAGDTDGPNKQHAEDEEENTQHESDQTATHPHGDDQKVWLGNQEREQKVALRAKDARRDGAAARHEANDDEDDDDDDDDDDGESDGETGRGEHSGARPQNGDGDENGNGNGSVKPSTPGDGNSFQDVDL